MTSGTPYWRHEWQGDRYAAAGDVENARIAYGLALELRPDATWIRHKMSKLAPEPRERPDLLRLNLFLPWYTPRDPERAEELRQCVDRNIDNPLIASVTLLIDDDTVPHRSGPGLHVVRLPRRPSYRDWVETAARHCPGQIAILANSDIHFDGSIARLYNLFARDPEAFVALSRFDQQGEALVPHPNPHWSQDTWAFIPQAATPARLARRTDIPLGVPRCDNHIAYVFATEGYTVYNPFPFVRSIHVHETGLRYYSKTGDRTVIGGMAMVQPGADLETPAKLSIELWTEKSTQITEIKVNKTLERWAAEARERARPRPAWLAHDTHWQYPAITEQHAFERMRALLPAQPGPYEAVYLGFPFATLIDLIAQIGPDHPRTRALRAELDALVAQLGPYRRVVSVCQHIRGREHAAVFKAAGITDLFWSHLTQGETAFAAVPGMRLHPFPLYPVQQLPRGAADLDRPRRWLYSFVGARAQKNYLSQVRTHIIEQLAGDPRGHIIDRDAWHYQKVVYDAQVFQRGGEQALVDAARSEDFRQVMDESVFTLCPSGSGPNSIRLWEAMVNGSIPVILAETWAAPGDPALWEAATIRVPESADAVAALPARLAAIAADPPRLRAMRQALMVLTERYGPEGFVGDVADMVLSR